MFPRFRRSTRESTSTRRAPPTTASPWPRSCGSGRSSRRTACCSRSSRRRRTTSCARTTPTSFPSLSGRLAGLHALPLVPDESPLTRTGKTSRISTQICSPHVTRAHVAIKQLPMALSLVHDMTVVHRDIKIENVLVDGSGELKLVGLCVCVCARAHDQYSELKLRK